MTITVRSPEPGALVQSEDRGSGSDWGGTVGPPGATSRVDAPAGRRRRSVVREIAARRASDMTPQLAGQTYRSLARSAAGAPEPRPFAERLVRPGLHLIAEVKRSSPSAGRIAPDDLDILVRARAYAAGGAVAISVLCEPHWFGGSIDDLRVVRSAVAVPVLAKEFVVDSRQLPLLRAAGADAVLLLASIHPAARLASLVARALDIGLEPLVEAHDERELDAALESGARVIGLNNRDLRTLDVDPERAVRLRGLVPDDRLVVAESGVRDASTVAGWRALGFDAALVGEALMRSPLPEAAVRAFVAAGAAPDDPGNVARAATVKICGVVDEAGAVAAIAAGADAIGLILAPGSRRALRIDEAAALAASVRRLAGTTPSANRRGHGRRLRRGPRGDRRAHSTRMSSSFPARSRWSRSRRSGRTTWKALHLPPDVPTSPRRWPRPLSPRRS